MADSLDESENLNESKVNILLTKRKVIYNMLLLQESKSTELITLHYSFFSNIIYRIIECIKNNNNNNGIKKNI